MNKPASIDEYIQNYPEDIQVILHKIRGIVRAAAPDATESISYGMPAFKLRGVPLVYFAAWEHHIGFYATPSGNQAFKKELAPYQGAKGSVRFPLDKPIPYELIEQIAKFKVGEVV
jgi:uncharacterized protein YdhG (YjbR/CyaY superfamily)